jgi:hypothetical protein
MSLIDKVKEAAMNQFIEVIEWLDESQDTLLYRFPVYQQEIKNSAHAMEADELQAYMLHRLALVGWQGRPDIAGESFAVIHACTGGIPRRVNQLANRLLLHAAVTGLPLIEPADAQAVARELEADSVAPQPAPQPERVLPLRAARRPLSPANEGAPAPVIQQVPITDPELERRIAALEARAEEQEATLRRVLTLLVDWVEGGNPEMAYRTNVA